MSVRSEAAKLIKSGYSPHDVATRLGKTERPEELKRLLLMQVGEGELLLSEIYFSIPEARRTQYQNLCQSLGEDYVDPANFDLIGRFVLKNHDFQIESQRSRNPKMQELPDDLSLIDCDLFWLSKDSPYTDTYRFLRDLEMTLHRLIKKTLEHFFKAHDDAWWKEGVPEETRKRCAVAKESDASVYLESHAYMNFIDFKTIIGSKWKVFREVLPPDLSDDQHKKQLLDSFQQLNEIRNCVMHPIKQIPLGKDECDFVRKLHDQLRGFRWRKPVGTGMK